MNASKKTTRSRKTRLDGMFELGSLLDTLNRHYKIVDTPTKEDEKREQGDEVA